ncbi:MAG TPA: Na+/H+ antiporter subunit E [Anaerolineales bacterium]|nr:Na+/H+ antiporter subunit E [Anaerolineales bacterium]
MMRLLLSVLGLTVIYSLILLSAHIWDLAIGVGIATGTVYLFRRHLFGSTGLPISRFAQRTLALLRFAWFVYTDVIDGLWLVLAIVLGVRPLTRSGIVAIPIGERTENGVTVTGWALTLSPGSVLIDVDWERKVMLFHFIDATQPEALREKIQTFYERYQRPVFP